MSDYYRPTEHTQKDDCSDCLSVKEALLQDGKVREITIETIYQMTKTAFEFTEMLIDRKEFTHEEIKEIVSGYYTTDDIIQGYISEIENKSNSQLKEMFTNYVNDIGGGK